MADQQATNGKDHDLIGAFREMRDNYLEAWAKAMVETINAFGNMPGELIDYGAKALKPVDNYVLHYLKLWDNMDNPKVVEAWQAMNTWVSDNIPLVGGAFRQL